MAKRPKPKTFYAQRIYELRKQNKMSQKDLAERIGLSENGFIKSLREETFQIKYLEQIADIFSVSVSYFFKSDTTDTGVQELAELLRSFDANQASDPQAPYENSSNKTNYRELYLLHLHNEVNSLKLAIRRIEQEINYIKK